MRTPSELVLLLSLALAILLGCAVVSDVRHRKVSNALNLALLLGGVVSAWVLRGPLDGVTSAALGVGLALLIWFPMFALRLLGAGDVKLLAASGAWIGWQGIVVASLLTGICGGVLGVIWMLRTRGVASALHSISLALRSPALLRLQPYEPRERVPYAIAIAIGVAAAWWIIVGMEWRGGTL